MIELRLVAEKDRAFPREVLFRELAASFRRGFGNLASISAFTRRNRL